MGCDPDLMPDLLNLIELSWPLLIERFALLLPQRKPDQHRMLP